MFFSLKQFFARFHDQIKTHKNHEGMFVDTITPEKRLSSLKFSAVFRLKL